MLLELLKNADLKMPEGDFIIYKKGEFYLAFMYDSWGELFNIMELNEYREWIGLEAWEIMKHPYGAKPLCKNFTYIMNY